MKRSRLGRSSGMKRRQRMKRPSTTMIGDGKTPNKYWVSVSSDYYISDPKEGALEWASDIKGIKVDAKTVKVFLTYEEAKAYAESIELGKKFKGIEANTVAVEDRLSGEVFERSIGNHGRGEDIAFTVKKEKELGVFSTIRKAAREGDVNAGNLVDYIMRYEDGTISEEDHLRMFAYLIKTGQAWNLQGSLYGRPAARLIEGGVISKDGKINWDKVDELKMRE